MQSERPTQLQTVHLDLMAVQASSKRGNDFLVLRKSPEEAKEWMTLGRQRSGKENKHHCFGAFMVLKHLPLKCSSNKHSLNEWKVCCTDSWPNLQAESETLLWQARKPSRGACLVRTEEAIEQSGFQCGSGVRLPGLQAWSWKFLVRRVDRVIVPISKTCWED